MRRILMLTVLFAGLIGLAAPVALAADLVKVRITNPSALKLNVEIRDMVCDEKVIWQGKMKPGESRKLRICAGAGGTGIIRAVVAGGCASAQATIHDGLRRGDEVAVAPAAEIGE